MSWVGVPQPCDGRCWNCPTESWSPPGVLVSADSCMAVATAMTQARGGRWSCWPTATMMAALATCALVHRPMGGHPPAGGAGGLPGAAPVRLGAGLVQARATPPAPRRAPPTQHMTMTSTTPVRAATALALTVGSFRWGGAGLHWSGGFGGAVGAGWAGPLCQDQVRQDLNLKR